MADERENSQNLKEEDENVLLWATLGIGYGIDVFATRIEREIALLRNAGVSQREIVNILRNDLATNGRIFGELRNSIKRGVTGGINQAFRRAGEMGQGLKWIAVSKNICDDCRSRAGEIDTWEGWETRGMPGSGWSICKEYCYCQLMPESLNIDDSIKL